MSARPHRPTPVGALARGLIAGVAGTGVMTGWQALSARLESSGEQTGGGQAQDGDPWAQAPAPAQVGRRIIEGVLRKPVAPERIGLLTNVMHWGYGTTWGAVYGLLSGSAARSGGLRRGALLGTGVWVMSYVQLVPLGLYELPWRYSPKVLGLDLSYHLAYGLGTGAAYGLIDRR
jgi:hypothetical protein